MVGSSSRLRRAPHAIDWTGMQDVVLLDALEAALNSRIAHRHDDRSAPASLPVRIPSSERYSPMRKQRGRRDEDANYRWGFRYCCKRDPSLDELEAYKHALHIERLRSF
jgi:hypothetical protein